MATCAHCGETLSGKRRDALYCSVRCKKAASQMRNRSAANKRGRRWAMEHPDRVKAQRDRQNEDYAAWAVTRAKHRAKKRGIPFDLAPSDLAVPERCPVLRIPLVRGTGTGRGGNDNSPSLDRIDPSLGYVRGNVRVISQRANLLKSDATLEELEAVVEDARRIRRAGMGH